MSDLLGHRLLFVTGKGGVGKTSVAAALGLLASAGGRRVLVCEAEARGDLAAAYECGATGFEPREVRPGLAAMSMDTEASLREYLRVQAHMPVVGRLGPVARAFDLIAAAAPGVRELLTVGKLCWEVREEHYDLVVVDSAATGHIVGELAAPVGVNELVREGAVRNQTRWMLDILETEGTTGAVIVATAEEAAVSEAIELAGRLKAETGVHLAALVANRVPPAPLGRGEAADVSALAAHRGEEAIAGSLGRAAAGLGEVLETAALALGIREAGVVHLERLRAAIPDVPSYFLPEVTALERWPETIAALEAALDEELGG